MKHNFVAKHMKTYCKSQTMVNRKKEFKSGKRKHKEIYHKEFKTPYFYI